MTKRVRNRRTVVAAVLAIGAILVVIIPLAAMVAYVVRDGANGIRFVTESLRSDDVAAVVHRLPAGAQRAIQGTIERLPQDMDELFAALGGGAGAASSVRRALSTTGSIALNVALTVIALFFLLARGSELVEWAARMSPLGRSRTAELFETFRKVSYSVIVATGGTAAVQAIAALVGYWIARVPSPYFFALVTFFGALVPAIGAAGVCLVAALLLLVAGHPYAALFLSAWALLVVGVVDNFVKPLFLRRGLEIHGAIMFFSLIAGVAAFGGIGLLLGPLAVSFFLAVVRMYQRDYAPGAEQPVEVDADGC